MSSVEKDTTSSTSAMAGSFRVVAGVAVASISLLAAVGGLRIACLLLFSFDFGFRPYELAVIPIALIGLWLCRANVPGAIGWLRSVGTTIAISSIIVALLIASLSRWGFMLSSGGFP